MQRVFTDKQVEAIDTDGRDICVAAGAGSGKTGVLVERFVRLVTQSRNGSLPAELRAGVDQILVITFTEKATKEMKARIVAELTRMGLADERRRIETAYISTIHGFCSRLLQENPFEVGIDPHFTVLEEPEARRLLRQTVDAVISSAYETGDEEITGLVDAVQGLRRHGEEQADPVASLAVAIEALLGSLRSAGRRCEEVERHWRAGAATAASCSQEVVRSVLAPVFEEIRLCAKELETLRAGLLGTARATCELLLGCAKRITSPETGADAMPAVRELVQLTRKARTKTAGTSAAEMELVRLVGRIKAACDAHEPLFGTDLPDPEKGALVCHRMWRLAATVWRSYGDAKRTRGKVDNDDLQAECVRLLEDFPDVRKRYQHRLRYLMVDEFQDTNPLQMRLIQLLHVGAPASPGAASAGRNRGAEEVSDGEDKYRNYLFVVGDVQQSIYGFRGAEPSLFRNLERAYRQEGAGVHVPLVTNFRSRDEILRLIAQLFRQVWRSDESRFVPLDAGATFDAATEPCIQLLVSQDLVRQDYLAIEPAALAGRIKQLVEGGEVRLASRDDPRLGQPVRYRDIAVLLRQLTDIQKYEEAFARAGVPFFVVGGGRGYYARQEIRDLLNILTVLDTPLNDVALMSALRTPMVGADVDTLYRIVDAASPDTPTNVGVHAAGPQAAGAAAADGDPIPQALASTPKAPLPLYIAMRRLLDQNSLPEGEQAKLERFADTMDGLRAQEDRMPVGHLLERLIARTSYDARLLCRRHGRRRLANVRKLLQMANADPVLGVREFIRRLRDLERLSDREGDAPTEEEAADVVRFHTIHGAKGLEFPIVIVADLSRSLDHLERGLFVCDPGALALGTRIGGAPDAAYRAIDHLRREADQQESDRLLYVAMTRARERLILCGNLGRNRGLNWGDRLFPALGVNAAPPQPTVQTLVGGIQAAIAPLSHYVRTSTVDGGGTEAAGTDAARPGYSARLVQALLDGQPVASVA